MDGCWAFWELGCVIDWQAWGAIGSLLAVATAIFISMLGERRVKAAKAQENLIILAQLYIEAKKILFTSEWCIQLTNQVRTGAIPADFDPPFKFAIRDIKTLNTLVYDLHGHVIPQFERMVANVLIGQYTNIKTNLNMIQQTLIELKDLPDSNKFNRLELHISALQMASFNIVEDLAHTLGYSNPEDRNPGPESYTAWAAYDPD
ncbi:hypothetical protein EWH21_07145 [Pseudomonas sp. REST10]|uniref:hypothetical protein n=1 Tax=Pseudomonas sp. REST10 TaxID=2512235 RepID=UPI00240D982D|nr:hypothetical protein [Pseudomonas sp. REST10]WFC61508.1 hypothetical protein EWH21_07145 [Pseudomonas sp. REST10]